MPSSRSARAGRGRRAGPSPRRPAGRTGRPPAQAGGAGAARRLPPALLSALTLALLAAFAVPAAGQPRPGERDLEGPGGRSNLRAVVVTSVDSSGVEIPLVRVTLPYRSLVFTRTRDGYRAAVRAVVVAARGDERVGGGVGEAEARAPDYAATRGDGQLVCDVPLRLRGEAPVDLRVTAEVQGTSRRWKERLAWRPGSGLTVPLYFADVRLDLPSGAGGAALLAGAADTLRATVVLGRRPSVAAWPVGGVTLVARVAPLEGARRRRDDGEGEVVRRWVLDPAPPRAPAQTRRVEIPAARLPFGRLALSLWLESGLGDAAERLPCDPPREFVNLALRTEDDLEWQRHVGWLEGIADDEQRRRLRQVPAGERLGAWRALWERAAAQSGVPAADLERAHLLRVVEADRLFGDFGRGALSDRGRILIRYGTPDSVEHRADDLSYDGRWEIWYYHDERLAFTFFDAHNLGDYRLVSTGSF